MQINPQMRPCHRPITGHGKPCVVRGHVIYPVTARCEWGSHAMPAVNQLSAFKIKSVLQHTHRGRSRTFMSSKPAVLHVKCHLKSQGHAKVAGVTPSTVKKSTTEKKSHNMAIVVLSTDPREGLIKSYLYKKKQA